MDSSFEERVRNGKIPRHQEQEVLRMDSSFKERVRECLSKEGWRFRVAGKIRGIRPDLVAEKDGKLAVVEVKGVRGGLDNGIKRALHFKNAANYSYLAIQDEAITGRTVDVCKALGIGLIAIDKESKEIVRPEPTEALESVKSKVFHTVTEKPQVRKKGLLETLFRSRAFVQILGFLFLNQGREYYLSELARQANVSAPAALFVIERKMQPLGIIAETKVGNTTFYEINQDCVIYEELKRIFLKFELTDEIISDELEKIDIKYALIFGSFARGTEKESSDLDLLIIGDVERSIVLRSISELESKIGREINAIIWNERTFYEKIEQKVSLLSSINKNEIIMVLGDENEFRRTITQE